MSTNIKKVLLIRYNSIGDIVLTTPVIKALDKSGYEVHYLCKKSYSSLVENNPRVYKVWEFKDNFRELIPMLQNSKFDCIVDLHNNYRSIKIKKALGVKSYTLVKNRIKLHLMTRWGLNLSPEKHIVNRFLDTISDISDIKDNELEFYIPDVTIASTKEFLPNEDFISIAVGAAFFTKQIPVDSLIDIIDSLDFPIVLLGGTDDIEKSKIIEIKSEGQIHNLTGQLSIDQSAYVIKESKLLISGDTGLKHIAASLCTKVVAIYGSTHPKLGYTPHVKNADQALIIGNEELSCRPCTKQGNNVCPKGHFKCMIDLDIDEIVEKINRFID